MKYVIPVIIGLLLPFQGFAQTYFLNGNAIALANDCYQLTTTATYQNGTVWYADQIDLNHPFDIQFQMNLGSLDGNGADGICFVLQTVGTNAIGTSGGGLGYLNFGTSLGIEFDTWQNADYGDPFYDHIAIERDGDINHNSANNIAGPVQMDPFDQNTEDGQNHTVQINWDPVIHIIKVYFDCNLRLQGDIDLVNSIFSGQNLVYWGFTAATGGSYNNQTVCLQENILSVGDEVTICPGASTVLSAGSSLNGVYTWSPTDYLDDPASATPTATPPATTTYTVTFTDLCGNNVNASIDVNVQELLVNLPDAVEINCSNSTQTVASTSNFANLNYNWTTDTGNITSGQGTGTISLDSPGTYTVSANYQNLCFAENSITIDGNFDDFSLTVPAQALINCANPNANITAITTLPGAIFSWTTNDGTINGVTNAATVNVSSAGIYTITAVLNANCSDQAQVSVIGNFYQPEVNIASTGIINCSTPTLTLSGSSDINNATINWSTIGGGFVTGQQSYTPTINSDGTYILFVTNPQNGCTGADTLEVQQNFIAPIVQTGIQDTITCITPEVEIQGISVQPSTGITYTWSTADGNILNGGSSASPLVNASGTYDLIVTNTSNGCSSSLAVEILTTNDFDLDLSSLSFPNVFTPNGDGKNGPWRPFLKDDPERYLDDLWSEYDLKIYNRWGGLVFEGTSNGQKNWNGFDGEEGVYFYTLHFKTACGNGVDQLVEGYIHLLK